MMTVTTHDEIDFWGCSIIGVLLVIGLQMFTMVYSVICIWILMSIHIMCMTCTDFRNLHFTCINGFGFVFLDFHMGRFILIMIIF